MIENPYQSPGENAPPADGPIIGLHSYHVPFIIAAACGIALAVIFSAVPREVIFPAGRGVGFFGACLGFIFGTLAFDIPVCGLVIWEWWRTGEPPKLNFEPLVDPAETRALRRTLKQRPHLDDETFYRSFYSNSGVSKETVLGVRREMQSMLGRSLAGVHPGDDMGVLEPEVDFADLLDELADAFEIVIPWWKGEIDIDGSFDSLVRLVADRVTAEGPSE